MANVKISALPSQASPATTAIVAIVTDPGGTPVSEKATLASLPVSTATQTALDAKVTGPASATDNALVRYDATTGKLIQNSAIIVDDSDNVIGMTTLTLPNTGLHILDTNATHDLIIIPGSNLSADRNFTITTGDAARTLSMAGDITASGALITSGGHSLTLTTTGTTNVTLPTSGTLATFTGTPSDDQVAVFTASGNVAGYTSLLFADATGTLSVVGGTDNQRLILQAHSTQTTNILEIRNSSAGVEGSISLSGGQTTASFDSLSSPAGTWAGGQAQTGIALPSTWLYTWSSGAAGASGKDTGLARNGAGVVEVNNGTAGTLRDLATRNVTATTAITVGASGVATGQLKIAGTTSGTITITAPAIAGTPTYVLPNAVGGAGSFLTDVAGDGVLSWAVPAGSGDVSKVGTPANNQVGVWTGDGTIEGDANLTFDTATDTLTTVAIVGTTITATNFIANTAVLPDANDGAALGNATTSFSDLFLASGALINFANGDAVVTHSSGIITVSTGDLRVTTAGTNAASVVTVNGTQTLANKTLTTPVLGVATATSINKVAITAPATGSTLTIAEGKTLTASNTITFTGTDSVSMNVSNQKVRTIGFSVRDDAVATGQIGTYFVFPVAGTITGFKIVADTGTATVKTWKIASGTTAPTIANVINTSGVSLSSGTAIISSTVTDFTTTAVAANDIFAFDLTAFSGATKLMFQLEITVT